VGVVRNKCVFVGWGSKKKIWKNFSPRLENKIKTLGINLAFEK